MEFTGTEAWPRGLQSLYMDTIQQRIEKAKKESTLRQPSESCSCGLRPIDFENIITNIVHHPFSRATRIPNLLLLFPFFFKRKIVSTACSSLQNYNRISVLTI